jgi:glycosyltransferase involved in cell wall biosynthesis
MKVVHLSTDDYSGGASRAAYRLHQSFAESTVTSTMRVLEHQTANTQIKAGRAPRTLEQKIKSRLVRIWWEHKNRHWTTDNPILHSFGQISAGIVDEINRSDAEIVNLHWIAKLLSIEDIGKLSKPIVWTVHDMWAFCGGEHVAPDHAQSRFRQGYLADNRPQGESGPDLNRVAWEAKRLAWAQQKFAIVTPSRWMATCVAQSLLFREATVRVIPNPLDTELVWTPIDRQSARSRLGLKQNKAYVLFGSAGGMTQLKGEDLLRAAMPSVVAALGDEVELLIFGQYAPAGYDTAAWPCRVNWLGPVRDDRVMACIYSAADVMVVPSRQDNLPNTAVEAHACGTPVVAFKVGGLPDIIEHQKTGWLAAPFDTDDLGRGIQWILSDRQRWQVLSKHARDNAVAKYSPSVVVPQYIDYYQTVLGR